ncbi:MAG: hypothetical protein C0631_01720 [Sedimenticola sp.]|jgi:hypothetical protein|nr:MAG: hypothetical protein C0631_01720 [Sedimenticola sp.]
MDLWFEKSLGDGLLAWEPLDQIKQHFLSAYVRNGKPEDMAVFMRHESEGRLHCEVKVYFPPASSVVANELGAEPCPRPSQDGLSLLAGAEESWSVLFQESAE